MSLQQTASPIIVKIVQPAEKGLAEILLGSLGLTGVIALGAVLLGVVLAGLMYWMRSRSA
ncbi:MAG: hypothetical protein HY048_01460 [Acidobacteria bacterium]|nr:hypothetical protein [Acidobacteriota bacterium]